MTSTPGKDAKILQEVITNLHISHLEIIEVESPKPEIVLVSQDLQLQHIQQILYQVVKSPLDKLVQLGAFQYTDVDKVSLFQLLGQREKSRANPVVEAQLIEMLFGVSITLLNLLKLLNNYQIKEFKDSLIEISQNNNRSSLLEASSHWRDLLAESEKLPNVLP